MDDFNVLGFVVTMFLLTVVFGLAGSAMNIRSAIKDKPKQEWEKAVEFRYTLEPFACLPMASFLGMCAPFIAMGIGAALCGLIPSFRTWVNEHFAETFLYLIGGMICICFFGGMLETFFNKLWLRFVHASN